MLALAAVAVVCAACTAPVWARPAAKQTARNDFEAAEKMRDALDGLAPDQRTRKDYQRVIEAYRKVYYGAPTSNKADAAVFALGELLAECGRQFGDEHTLQAAIGQFEFLRKEYPGSKFRVDALYTIAEIYRDDLNDREQAKATFQEFLKRYPQSDLSDDARTALADLERPERSKKNKATVAAEKPEAKPKKKEKVSEARLGKADPSIPQSDAEIDGAAQSSKGSSARAEQAAAQTPAQYDQQRPAGTLPRVTGVRHWSTADYTRIAIDLDSEVKYEAGRIANPDRIFFDLYDTKVAGAILGKTFDIQDGLLRKVRVAQNQLNVSRVVLEVNGVADYSVFLLPNPYRLIIDIHGRRPTEPQTILADKQAAKETARDKKTEAVARATATDVGKTTATASIEKPAKDQKKQAEAEKKITALEQELKRQEGATKAEDKTINVAKATEPDLKSTPSPTSKPTYESVAPRGKKKQEITEPTDTTVVVAKKKSKNETPEEAAAREASALSSGERSLVRALGLKIGRIVVDAGHGGHDTGTIGPNGLMEKDLVLDVSQRLGKLLRTKMGADVVYTREDDTFIPLETRTAVANQQQADLFISIHANSSADPNARGVETYYLNFTSSPDALDVAARENSVSDKSIHELQDLVKKITLKDKLDESREFAADVQKSLYAGLSAKSPAIRNRGVKKAPFIVLIGANMPSILAEISFVSNPVDAKHLQTPEYRQKVAESLYRGVAKYISGLAGVKVAATARPAPDAAR
jgi:N-acetylmuramoyl-L-alanine amidase